MTSEQDREYMDGMIKELLEDGTIDNDEASFLRARNYGLF